MIYHVYTIYYDYSYACYVFVQYILLPYLCLLTQEISGFHKQIHDAHTYLRILSCPHQS